MVQPLKINFFLVCGLICFIIFSFFLVERYNPRRLSFAYVPSYPYSNSQEVYPTELIIESVNIILPVIGAEIKDGEWEATTKGVSFLSTSALPGSKGNSVMYGHNWPNLLGPLVKVKPNDKVLVKFSDRTVQTFRVSYTQTVTPDQTHILSKTDDIRLTIYTCTGFIDRKRFVVTAIADEFVSKVKI